MSATFHTTTGQIATGTHPIAAVVINLGSVPFNVVASGTHTLNNREWLEINSTNIALAPIGGNTAIDAMVVITSQ